MVRKLVFILVLAFTFGSLAAKQIPQKDAENIAKTAFALKSKYKLRSANDIKTMDTYVKEFDQEPTLYIFNIEPKGFVIVSADDRYNAIIAFSDESHIDIHDDEKNIGLWGTLSRHEQRIDYIREYDFVPSPSIQQEWNFLRDHTANEVLRNDYPEGTVVTPLTTTLWNQGQFYNAFTPIADQREGPDGRTFCGCMPIAMSQMMKYHNHPQQGNGSNTYEDPDFGTQTADFCSTEYNWTNMPDSLTDYNDDVAEFIYHVGVSTNTHFSPVYTATFASFIRDALVSYFGYDESARWFNDLQGDFSGVTIQDLNQGRPVLITGESLNGGAHAWVADGYGYFLEPGPGQPDEYFHYNFGWGGSNNGWFLDASGSWAPIPFEFGTAPVNFYWNRFVIHNVFPSSTGCARPDLLFNSSISETGAFLHVTYRQGEQDQIYRWRKVGEVDWIESEVTQVRFHFAGNLEPGTEYEFQVARKCCPETWSEFSDSEYFTTEGVNVEDACARFIDSRLSTSSISESSAFVYTDSPYGDNANQFRYRFRGSLLWIYTDVSTNYYRGLSGLEEGTEYEYQVRHQCVAGIWMDFSSSHFFTTSGGTNCNLINVDEELFTSSITQNNAYIYTSQPYGRLVNQFRYRPTGTTAWTQTDETNNYFRYLRGLEPGTEYEFQVRHQCGASGYTDYSFSHTFVTAGGQDVDCEALSANRLYTSSITGTSGYIYTPQPYGFVANQFRYREVGSGSWTETARSTSYYRFLNDLTPSTTYEFQVRHECSINNWSDFSSSHVFSTLARFDSGTGYKAQILPLVDHPSQLRTSSGVTTQLAALSIVAYPNPVVHTLTLDVSNNEQAAEVNIFNIAGELMQNVTIDSQTPSIKIDMMSLDSGIYILEYFDGQNRIIEKVIKE